MSRRTVRLATRRALLGALTLVVLAGWWPPVAAAHPLDEYLQVMYLTLAPDGLTLELDLTPGVLVAPQVVAAIDTDGDGAISDPEGQAYARVVLADVQLGVDGQPYSLTVTKVELPTMLALTAGMGTIRLEAAGAVGPGRTHIPVAPGAHQAFVQNAHAPVKSAYQVTAVLGPDGGIEVARQQRDDLQRSLRVDYAVAPLAPADAGPAATAGASSPGGTSERQRWLMDTLHQPAVSPWLLLTALAVAAMLGGLHALTPGHGKTLLASYLVGSRGTVRHAVCLGGTVTFTHTASVVATGLLVLLAGQLIVPDVLVPALGLVSGLLVVVLGARLVWARWRSLRHGHDHDHAHGHGHPHAHAHPDLGHSNDDAHAGDGRAGHTHTHPDPAETVSWRDLVAMGASGGMTPCPEAIGILLVAIGLNRVALGMGLIVAFSLGLAAVLCLLGLLLVRSRGLINHFGVTGRRTQRLLPLGSAIMVTALGAAITAKAVLTYLS